MSNEKLLNRIKKLLAFQLALDQVVPGTADQNEADAAMLKAQELLLANNLTMEHVADVEDKDEVVNKTTLASKSKSVPSWKIRIASVICPNYRVEVLTHYDWRFGSEIMLVGMKRDTEICKEVLEFSFACFNRFFKQYLVVWKEENPNKIHDRSTSIRVRNTYLSGFVFGLGEKFRKQVTEKGLMIVIPNAVKEEIDNMMLGTRSISGGKQIGDSNAYSQGKRDASFVEKHQSIE